MTAIETRQGFLEFLRTRRSVRRFTPDPVPIERINQLLEAAILAPSAHNRQPWRFAVIADAQIRQRLADAMGEELYRDLLTDGVENIEARRQVDRSRDRIVSAPLAILICLDLFSADPYPDESRQRAEFLMGVQSVALAGGTLLLAAHAEGLGAVWMCAPLFTPEIVRKVLDLPVSWDPQGLILLGYPATKPSPRLRHAIEDVALFFT